jgi:hypothetical protein
MQRCQKCGHKTSNTKLCTKCKRGYKFKNNCIGCGCECSGLRCRNCNRLFIMGRTSTKPVGKCDDCGKTISESSKRCRACANKASKQGKPPEGRHTGGWGRSARINRCPTCGARIDTKRCYGCEIAEKKQRELEMRRHSREVGRATDTVSTSSWRKPKPAQNVESKPKEIPGHLRHPDIVYGN